MINQFAIDPVALKIGPIHIYWYGIAYLVGFALAWILARYRAKKMAFGWSVDVISDFIFYCALGAIIGGRLGYILFYGLGTLVEDTLFIFKIWQGGMSFHGGLIGVTVALAFFARKEKMPILQLLDFTAPLAPLGLALGRMGNFINGEVWGRVTEMPWGMVFPHADLLPRHPSQLYEALTEGVLLFIIIWVYTNKPRAIGRASGLFLLGYGVARFGCEFFRTPDSHLGFVLFDWMTMGQILSLPMIIVGCYLIGRKNKLSGV